MYIKRGKLTTAICIVNKTTDGASKMASCFGYLMYWPPNFLDPPLKNAHPPQKTLEN
jgi:hypothetical protein